MSLISLYAFIFEETFFLGTPTTDCFSLYMSNCYIQKKLEQFPNIMYECKMCHINSLGYKLMFSSVSNANKFASFLFEK